MKRFLEALVVLLLLTLSGCWIISRGDICVHDLETLTLEERMDPAWRKRCEDKLEAMGYQHFTTDLVMTEHTGTTTSETGTSDTGTGDTDPTVLESGHTGFVDPELRTDNDGDGYCESSACTDDSQPGDCDDTEPFARPGLPEVCDDIDNDCQNGVDDGLQTFTWYWDFDQDAYGNPAASATDCQEPEDYVANDDDCDDTNGAVTTTIRYYKDRDRDGVPTSSLWDDNDCVPSDYTFILPPDINGDGSPDFDSDDNNPNVQ